MKLSVLQNLPLKLVALALAIIMWILVVGERRSELRLTVPLELRNLPERLEISDQSTTQVEVAVRGYSSVLKKLTPGDIDVHIDLSTVVEGPSVFSFSPEDIVVPLGVSVLQVSPSQVDLFLDATGEKTVPIKPVTRGTLVAGYTLDKVSAEPKMVTITGARRLLNTITQAETDPVVIDDLAEDTVKKVKLRLPTGVRNEEENKVITVTVTVSPNLIELVFDDIPLQVEGETRKYILSPAVITAFIAGPELELGHLTSKDIPVFVATRDLPEGQSSVQPTFKLPETMTIKRYYPKSVIVTLTK